MNRIKLLTLHEVGLVLLALHLRDPMSLRVSACRHYRQTLMMILLSAMALKATVSAREPNKIARCRGEVNNLRRDERDGQDRAATTRVWVHVTWTYRDPFGCSTTTNLQRPGEHRRQIGKVDVLI